MNNQIVKQIRGDVAVVPFSRNPVDIIIPFHGQYEKVSKLVESILRGIRSNPYQITLVDDASPNPSFIKEFEKVDDKPPPGCNPIVQGIRNESQLGFGGALKVGFANTNQPYVVFLNSDCFIEDVNWLIGLGQSLLEGKRNNVRMVSSMMNNSSNKALVAKREDRRADYILQDGYLPLVSVMCHRRLFEKIGGFIKSYPYGWYEDEELGYRMKKFGYKQAVCGKSWVRHYGEATINDLWKHNPEAIKIMESNRERCLIDIQKLL